MRTTLEVTRDVPLEGGIGLLPSAKEENAVRLLEDVAEDDLELERCPLPLQTLRGKIRERL